MDLKAKLTQIGLTEKQAIIYSSLLENGLSPARLLIIRTGLKRGITYEILEQLIKLNLVEKVEDRGKIALFRTTHPQELENFFQKKKKETEDTEKFLKNEMGNFTSMYNLLSGKPNVRFFEGEEGIEKVLEDSLTSKEAILTYADLEAIIKYIPQINEKYSKNREKLGIQKKGLIMDTEKSRKIISDYHTKVTETKFIKYKAPEFGAVMQIYDGKISYLTLKDQTMIGVIIEDKTIYELEKSIFEHLWTITT